MRWSSSEYHGSPWLGITWLACRMITALISASLPQHEGRRQGELSWSTDVRSVIANSHWILQLGVELTVEERNLLSVSYKNVRAPNVTPRPWEGSAQQQIRPRPDGESYALQTTDPSARFRSSELAVPRGGSSRPSSRRRSPRATRARSPRSRSTARRSRPSSPTCATTSSRSSTTTSSPPLRPASPRCVRLQGSERSGAQLLRMEMLGEHCGAARARGLISCPLSSSRSTRSSTTR